MGRPPIKTVASRTSSWFLIVTLLAATVSPAGLAQSSSLPPRSSDDEAFLDQLERDAWRYFWDYADRKTGLIADSTLHGSPSSIAAVGFGLAAVCIAHARGWISSEDAYGRVLKTLRTVKRRLKHEHGFFYHFVEMSTGQRAWSSEVSSIDTALLLAGALFAGQYFHGTPVERLATELYERVDWTWMTHDTPLLCMGWTPERGFFSHHWDWYSEGILLYALAIGSPTHPIPAESWFKWRRAKRAYRGVSVVYSYFGSLFTYQTAHAWIDFRTLYEGDLNYWQNSINAVLANRQFCLDHAAQYRGYGPSGWGLTAGEGPDGYRGYGAEPAEVVLHDGTINPYGVVASLPLLPDVAIASLKELREAYREKVYGEYGFKAGFNVDRDWWGKTHLGIDEGVSLLMIENYRTEMVWKTFQQLPSIQRWIALCLTRR